jgi:magnesium-protoporphyrin IX monomethyl ester (oxidative) cyclase
MMDNNAELPHVIKDLENDSIDFAMTGEGEFSFLELVNKLINKEDISKVPGLTKKIGEKKYLINPPVRIHDLNLLPRPARHLVDMEGYFKIGAFHSAKSRSNRVLSVMCSRGCPEKCTFCSTPQMWGTNTRWRTTEHIMSEISNDVRDFNIGEIQFDDDTLTVNKKNLFSLCAELEKIGLPWCTPNGTKVNYHFNKQEEMYKVMADSGCYQITLACESGVQRVLDDIVNKRLPLETIYPSIENAKKAGMLVHTFWILGYPGETYEEIQKTIDFAMNSGADSFSFAILSPLPGTPIYRKVVKENLWWDGRCLDDMLFRSSLIKVDGFSGPDDFEIFVNEANTKANLLLKTNDPKRFAYKYGENADKSAFVKQT